MLATRLSAILVTLVAFLVLSATTSAQDFDKGMLAYKHQKYREAVEEFLPLARSGDTEAQYMLGLMYTIGRGTVWKDFSKGLYWYRRAAENGHAHGRHWLHRTAEGGDSDAQFDLGVMYIQGRGVPQDSVKALRWFRLASLDDGHVPYLLGRIYQTGVDASQDAAEALRLLRFAALDDARVSYLLGRMYEEGRDIPQDYTEAVRWFRLAAERDDSYTSHWESLYMRYRQLAERGDSDVLRWFYSAAEQGDVEAQYTLAIYLYSSNRDNNSDDHASRGDSAAATRLLRVAAGQGHVDAQAHLGFIYSEGLRVQQNHVKAARWLRLAAEGGSEYAQFRLGELYEKGVGVRKNIVLAYKWGRLAEVQQRRRYGPYGSSIYLDALERYRHEMTPAQIQKAERLALKWVERPEWRTRIVRTLLTWWLSFG